ncbi:MAG: LysR family transcriptional regulator [Rhodobacteraceae bacterium]|nr:LysR family transcriptional regulator [Paracoccaceae bacterium]
MANQYALHKLANDMIIFVAVVEAGSFTGAAAGLGLGRARVSQIVGALELRLGVKLLNRTTRSLSLTEIGAAYFEKCRLMAALGMKANDTARAAQESVRGVLRIKVPVAAMLLTPVISAFIREYPEISIELIESDLPVDMVEQRLDVAFTSGPLEDSPLRMVPFGTLFEILCASKSYIETHGMPTRVQDLTGLDWVAHEAASRQGKITVRRSGHPVKRLRLKSRVVAGSAASLKQFVLNGAGFGVLPSALVAEELASGTLVRILPDYHGYEIPVMAVFGYQNTVPLKVRVFLDYMKANLRFPASD